MLLMWPKARSHSLICVPHSETVCDSRGSDTSRTTTVRVTVCGPWLAADTVTGAVYVPGAVVGRVATVMSSGCDVPAKSRSTRMHAWRLVRCHLPVCSSTRLRARRTHPRGAYVHGNTPTQIKESAS